MPRRTRNWLDCSCYHLTHRCLDRNYFFEHSITRDTYMKELREMIERFKIDILDYIVTSNHVHLLVYAGKGTEIAMGMQYLQGRMAQRYNMLRGREGAFWSGRYHATLIENGIHLSQCMFYIDYNMMRSGIVSHPSEWKHSGYHELCGAKMRYMIINKRKLLSRLGMSGEDNRFKEWYVRTIDSKSSIYMKRVEYWTESLAVGDESWIGKIKGLIGYKRLRVVAAESEKSVHYTEDQSQPFFVNEQKTPYLLY